jgi:hypothetical protein
MKIQFGLVLFTAVLLLSSCDPQSGITKKSLEKFGPTPTPSISPAPSEAPIDPADVVQVDTSVEGPTLNINIRGTQKNAVCDKFNRVMVNGSNQVATIKGVCSQIVINGNGNDVTAEAAMQITFNGTGNKVSYSRYGNGKRPVVGGNTGGNTAEKITAAAPPAKK